MHITGVAPGLDVVDSVLPVAADPVDDGQPVAPVSVGEDLHDGCEDGAPSGNPAGLHCAIVEPDTDAQSGGRCEGAFTLIHPAATGCSTKADKACECLQKTASDHPLFTLLHVVITI